MFRIAADVKRISGRCAPQNAPHEGISEYYESIGADVPAVGITPEQEWNRDSRALRYLDAKLVGEAFMHHEKRKVNNV